ncbi:MAG: hypothetical protein AAGJ32_11985 [Pseudomonadota bacterium]
MRDLRADLGHVEQATRRLASANGSRAIMVLAADRGAGSTSVAVSLALRVEALAARAVWLVDLNLDRSDAFDAFASPPFSAEGEMSRPYDASLGRAPIYSLSPETQLEAQARGSDKLLCVHQVSAKRLLVTRMRHERLSANQRIQFRDSPSWWPAVRTAADWTIVDAPALSETGTGLTVAQHTDGVVIVLRAGKTYADDAIALRRDVEAAGGRVIGLVLNGMNPVIHRLTGSRLRRAN